jgi:hypothetical protein
MSDVGCQMMDVGCQISDEEDGRQKKLKAAGLNTW